MMNLHFNQKARQYSTIDSQKCGSCGGMIRSPQHFLFQTKYWAASKRRAMEEHIFCMNCLSTHNYSGDIENNILVSVVDEITDEDSPVFWTAPSLARRKNMTTFEAAETQIGQEEIIDKTHHAGRMSWENMMIGVDPGPDRLIDLGSIAGYIEDLKHSEEPVKELEHRKSFKEEDDKKK